ncbi:MAG: type I DNA topoisomerase [Bacteroidetes bacterium]|nr:type I DNA topoisomerase [Bacteroidota bacterium]
MIKNLVIVESPAKAKTIEKILGTDYIVKSSFGHIRDLPKKGVGIDVENEFAPTYEVSADKKSVVSELKKLTKEAEKVWLASDEDREGEAIAWHLSQVLGIENESANRIVFHEITSSAIIKAIENPRSINIELVNAQQARRILDRLVGFELSPVLWRKVKPSLSAGRVQSVSVRLVVDREREIIAFTAGNYFRVTATFTVVKDGETHEISTELSKKFKTLEEATLFLKSCHDFAFSIGAIDKKQGKKSPSAPFTTSSLQQEASRKLGFSVSQTMRVAQTLYESGFITYMRTDSTNLSNDAINAIDKEVTSRFGNEYFKHRVYATKTKGAQEAHEAIRPTTISKEKVSGTKQETKLYDLIWRRTVASQMQDAAIEKTTIQIATPKDKMFFVTKGEIVVFEGFLKIYDGNDKDTILPPVAIGDALNVIEAEAQEKFEQRPSRYSEASLVRQLEELGIGRPSTYAPTISTIINRGYVIKEDRDGIKREYKVVILNENGTIENVVRQENTGAEKSKLFPTDIGIIVTDYLKTHFSSILDYNFTASVERQFDDIANGELVWQKMLTGFYGSFHKSVDDALNEDSFATPNSRLLGVDPKTEKNVYSRMGRFGAMVQLGETLEDKEDIEHKPKYATLDKGMLIETVTLEQALTLLKMPRDLGNYEEYKVVVGLGRFGPYIRHNGIFTSIPKECDPYSIMLDAAIELIELKRKRDREKVLRTYEEDTKLQIHNGRWGAYIHYDGENYKADKTIRETLVDMPFEEVMEIVKKQMKATPAKKKSTKTTKKTTTKKVSAKKTTAKATAKATAKKATAKKAVTKKKTAAKKSALKTVKTVTAKKSKSEK